MGTFISTAEQSERKAIRKRQLEVDRVELKRKIQEAVEEFDTKLLNLYKMRVAIEKCILAEELKILLYDRRMSVQDQLDREEEKLVTQIQVKEEEKEIADQDLIDGKKVLDELKLNEINCLNRIKFLKKISKKNFLDLDLISWRP